MYSVTCIRVVSARKKSFGAGFVFWYWPYYSPANSHSDTPVTYNDNDFGGYSVAQLYIEQGRHADLKQEMLAYVATNWEPAYYKDVSLKAEQYMKTDRVRRLKAKEPEPDGMRYYEITKAATECADGATERTTSPSPTWQAPFTRACRSSR